MRRVVIESPYAGEVESNLTYLRRCIKDCLTRGEAPIASHGLFTRFFDDDDWAQRTLCILAGHSWIQKAAALVVYEDYGTTKGMILGIEEATRTCIPVEYRTIGVNDEQQAKQIQK